MSEKKTEGRVINTHNKGVVNDNGVYYVSSPASLFLASATGQAAPGKPLENDQATILTKPKEK